MVTTQRRPEPLRSAWWLRWSWRDLRSPLGRRGGDRAGAGDRNRRVRRPRQHGRVATAVERRELRRTGDARPTGHAQPGHVRRAGCTARRDRSRSTMPLRSSRRRERLVVDSQVDTARRASRVGPGPGPHRRDDVRVDAPVDDVWVSDGTAPRPIRRRSRGVLEAKFADQHGPADRGNGPGRRRPRSVDYIGLGVAPEDFFYEGPEGTIFAAGDLATSISRWLRHRTSAGTGGMVNDAVLVARRRRRPGRASRRELSDAIA